MKRIVLLRHGQSQWNLENRFTGWTDVDLTEQGLEEARKAGELLKKEGFKFGMAYTSYLKRAIKTLNNVIDAMNADWIPVQKSWRLNEKHYGMLQGLNKSETAAKYGEEQVLIWRRSFDIAPDPIAEDDKERNAKYEDRYAEVPDAELPRTESLKDCIGNSLRGVIKHLKGISDEDIISLNLPTALPYVFEFDDDLNLVKDYFLGDPEEIKKLQEAVANQGKK